MTEKEKRAYFNMSVEERREYNRKNEEAHRKFMETYHRDFWLERVKAMLEESSNQTINSVYHFLLHAK